MKQVVNFRLNAQDIAILNMLEKKLHLTKTGVIEQALHFYAKSKLSKKNFLLECAGTISNKDAEEMLHAIKNNKNIKDLKVKL